MATSTRPGSYAFSWYDPRSASTRLVVSTLSGVIATASLPRYSWAVRAVVGWDVFSIVSLGIGWFIILGASPSETQRRAGSQDPGRAVAGFLVLFSCVFSLFAATVVLRKARQLAPEASDALVALCLTAVVSAWLLTHSTYTLRYARLFYREDDDGIGGLEFPGADKRPPDDLDFAYFAFTLGMCFQVSDVTISSHRIRRTALVHALISFAYNTTVVALALNLVFGLFG